MRIRNLCDPGSGMDILGSGIIIPDPMANILTTFPVAQLTKQKKTRHVTDIYTNLNISWIDWLVLTHGLLRLEGRRPGTGRRPRHHSGLALQLAAVVEQQDQQRHQAARQVLEQAPRQRPHSHS
jgi:hypothetical protein